MVRKLVAVALTAVMALAAGACNMPAQSGTSGGFAPVYDDDDDDFWYGSSHSQRKTYGYKSYSPTRSKSFSSSSRRR